MKYSRNKHGASNGDSQPENNNKNNHGNRPAREGIPKSRPKSVQIRPNERKRVLTTTAATTKAARTRKVQRRVSKNVALHGFPSITIYYQRAEKQLTMRKEHAAHGIVNRSTAFTHRTCPCRAEFRVERLHMLLHVV